PLPSTPTPATARSTRRGRRIRLPAARRPCILAGSNVIRKNLTPPVGLPAAGLPPTRRIGGARRNVGYRVALVRGLGGEASGVPEVPGWALNLSRGGLRAVVEDRVELGEEVDVRIADLQVERRGRIVWTQDEPDGTIVGISFFT